MRGVHPGDPRLAARIGRRLARLPGRWRWAVERLLRWWFAELAGLVPRRFAIRRGLGMVLQVPDDDLLEIAATLLPDAVGLAADRAAVLIAERTPFAPEAVLAGYRLDADGPAIRLTVRMVPLARLERFDPADVDAVVLEGAAEIAVMVGIAPSARQRAAERRRRVVAGAVATAAAIALLVPVVLRQRALESEQAELSKSRSVLQPALNRAAAGRAVRDATTDARRQQGRGLSAVAVLDRLSRVVDDDSYLTQMRINGREVSIGGVSGSASALPGMIEADALFEKVHLAAPVSRAPDGRQRFEIGFMVARR